MAERSLQGKKVLITGGAGFVGQYLARRLVDGYGCEVAATRLPQEQPGFDFVSFYVMDLLQPEEVKAVLDEFHPEFIFHLAAQSSVSVSWENPGMTLDVNAKGTTNLLEAARAAGGNQRVLLVGSGDEYGFVSPGDIPVKETVLPRPGNVYAVSKVSQNLLGGVYARAYRMDVLMTRAFNHFGPGQAPTFVVADFCRQVAEIEAGRRENEIRVGNLAAKRNFTDVRDVVAAYAMLAEKGERGETYNVGSPASVVIRDLLDRILEMARVPISVKVDTDKLRPLDVPVVEVDIGKLYAATGWRPRFALDDTLRETLDYWRKMV